jgi:exodeoxyribonuclease-3
LILLVFVLMILLIASPASAQSTKVMTYNVWMGFNKKQNLEVGADWIAAQNTDVLALQELKGFNQERLEQAARKWGHQYSVIFDRQGGFPQGLTAKTPIQKIEQIQPENNPKLRGTLHCKIAGVHFFVVHFDPRNYHNRRKEASAVAGRVKPLVEAGEQVVVLGDCNAHSIADQKFLSKQTALIKHWRDKEKENKSFRAFVEGGEIDFSVLQTLFDAGLVDPAIDAVGTFPTRLLDSDITDDELNSLMQRIDFILVSSHFPKCVVSYPRDSILDKISDHYPVILKIQ